MACRLHMAILAVAVIMAAKVCGGAVMPGFDVSSGFTYNSNLSNAQAWEDVRDDFFWMTETGATWNWVPGTDWRASVRLFGGLDVPFEYSAFRALRVGTDATLVRKFGLGPDAPRLAVSMRFERDFFEDPQMTRWFLRPVLKYEYTLAADWRAEISYRFDNSYAGSELFSGFGNEAGFFLRWEPEGRWSFFAGYRVRYGDVVSWSSGSGPSYWSWARRNASFREVADVVERGNTVFGRPMTAYRFEALTQSPTAGVSFAVTPDISLQVRGEYRYTSRESINYDVFLVHVGLHAAF